MRPTVIGWSASALVACILLTPSCGDSGERSGPASQVEPQEVDTAAARPILDAMLALESARDAKCHSTACRFENFLYGTPLDEPAREVRGELQKALLFSLWSEASDAAKGRGSGRVELADLEPVLDRFATETDRGEVLEVRFEGGDPHEIAPLRLRQYASISYSLRAILAAEQDRLVGGGPPLLPLAPEAVQALSHTLDLVMLAVLAEADRTARRDSVSVVDATRIRLAFERVLPSIREREQPSPQGGAVAASGSRAVLDRLIENKIESYRRYNAVSVTEATAIYRHNIQAFYARFPFPEERDAARAYEDAYDAAILSFVGDLLRKSADRAIAAGRAVARSTDVHETVQELIPHRVDDFEDVTFFPHLPRSERVVLESYDCDSYRDFGRHWLLLRRALERDLDLPALPDPFAVEIVTEAISDFGVLLHRMAGDHARSSRRGMHLLPEHVSAAMDIISDRARRDREARDSAPPTSSSSIVSAADTADLETEGFYFTDVTGDSGIDYIHRTSDWLAKFRRDQTIDLPTFSGGGVAAEDLDGDGNADVLFVGGQGNALYRGLGDGRFEDVTEAAGVDWRREDGAAGEARQPILADFDNDGVTDILITYVDDPHRVYRGLGGFRFEDVTARSNLGGDDAVGGAACVFDYDNDGLLDVYVTYFGNYLHGDRITTNRNNQNAPPNRLHRNRGNFRFALKSLENGAGDPGWAQAVSHTDFDRDGLQDIIVANDFGRNAWLRNRGNGRFENMAERYGLTNAYHSMNVGIAELNGDGLPDVYVSNIATMVKDDKYVLPDMNTPVHFDPQAMAGMLVKESNVLYVSVANAEGALSGYVESDAVERGESTTGWAWDAKFLDFDLDGDEDLYCVNGSNEYNLFFSMVGKEEVDGSLTHYYFNHDGQSNVFFVNDGGRFLNRSSRSGADFVGNSRSTVHIDFDLDGDLDIVVQNFHAPAVVLRNELAGRGRHFVKLRLVGDPEQGVNRDAIGARVEARTPSGLRMTREIHGGSGYLSMNPKELHFGLGHDDRVDVTIFWPNGRTQTLEGLEADRVHRIEQAR